MPMDSNNCPVIWRLLDGRPGHENQTCGLSDAIQRRIDTTVADVAVAGRVRGLRSFWLPRSFHLDDLPKPDLLIGAGHRTHLPLLGLQRRYGGRTIVIMKPSLPLPLFDLCLIPRHDRLPATPTNVVRIDGALNRITPGSRPQSRKGLMLIGGPSRHFYWNGRQVLERVREVIQQSPDITWTVVTSERTPGNFVKEWEQIASESTLIPFGTTSAAWLPEELPKAATIWVTGDSVSMIHEALTSGAEVGVFDVVPLNSSRVNDSLSRLVRQRQITLWSHWKQGSQLHQPAMPLRESDRCASVVIQRCLQLTDKRSSWLRSKDWSTIHASNQQAYDPQPVSLRSL